jgi:glucose 1-dehydrogenase
MVRFHQWCAVAFTQLVTVLPNDLYETYKMSIATGAYWPFLADVDLRVQRTLEIGEYTDPHHHATVPHTPVLAPGLVIDQVYVGYWLWGRPSPEQLWGPAGPVAAHQRGLRPHPARGAGGVGAGQRRYCGGVTPGPAGGQPPSRTTTGRTAMKGLQGKVAVVTGGSSGIGQAIAIRLGEEGVNVAINYVGPVEGAEATKEAIDIYMKKMSESGSRPILVRADVSSEDEVAQMFARVLEEYGRVDYLVNNAGIQIAADSETLPVAHFDKVLAVNLRGAFLCSQGAIRHLLEVGRPGAIVNVSSVHQLIPKPRFLGYSVSKGGMQNLTRTLALEYASRGIRVNGIGPGATVTPINRSWVEDPAKRAMVERHIPMRRAGDAEEMAAVTAFLCSDEAAYITGQTLFVDGGLTLYPSFETTWSSE